MSASGISDANPIMPASWSPAPQGDTPRPPTAATERHREANDGLPPKATTTFKPTQRQHKVDVRA